MNRFADKPTIIMKTLHLQILHMMDVRLEVAKQGSFSTRKQSESGQTLSLYRQGHDLFA